MTANRIHTRLRDRLASSSIAYKLAAIPLLTVAILFAVSTAAWVFLNGRLYEYEKEAAHFKIQYAEATKLPHMLGQIQSDIYKNYLWSATGHDEIEIRRLHENLRNNAAEFKNFATKIINDFAINDIDLVNQINSYSSLLDNTLELSFRSAALGANTSLALERRYESIKIRFYSIANKIKKDSHQHAQMMTQHSKNVELIRSFTVIVLAISSFLLTYKLASGISQPLLNLVGVIDQLREHNFAVTIPALERQDEVGKLAQAVSDFAMTLERNRELSAERQRMHAELEKMAYHDALTGCGNRSLFSRQLKRSFGGYAGTSALLLLDLDKFKAVNDSLGHEAGDQLLIEFANRLHDTVRPSDRVFRLGGDEFAVILDDLPSIEMAENVAMRMIECAKSPFKITGQSVVIGVSVGIAENSGQDLDPTKANRFADLALYRAKEDGRNRYRLYHHEIGYEFQRRHLVEQALNSAIDRSELRLCYQPQYDLNSGKMIGAEALLRWRAENLGNVSPGEFIPVAERSGLIIKLGNWVLKRSFEQLFNWQRSGFIMPRISINVSPQQLSHDGFIPLALSAITENAHSETQIVLEITEEVFIGKDAKRVINAMNQLRDAGYLFALDDFGTGYSSLSYLDQLPIDELKLDISFVRNIQANERKQIFVEGIVKIATKLGIEILAEGIETEIEKRVITNLGCRAGQGYYFAKPLENSDLKNEFHEDFVKT